MKFFKNVFLHVFVPVAFGIVLNIYFCELKKEMTHNEGYSRNPINELVNDFKEGKNKLDGLVMSLKKDFKKIQK